MMDVISKLMIHSQEINNQISEKKKKKKKKGFQQFFFFKKQSKLMKIFT